MIVLKMKEIERREKGLCLSERRVKGEALDGLKCARLGQR